MGCTVWRISNCEVFVVNVNGGGFGDIGHVFGRKGLNFGLDPCFGLSSRLAFLGWMGATLLALSGPAEAIDIYKWVDSKGKTHVSDTVPDEYRDVAKKMNSQKYEVTPEQRAEALALEALDKDFLAREKAKARAEERTRQRLQQQDADYLARENARKKEAAAQAARAADADKDACRAQWRQYHAASACFARFTTVKTPENKAGLRPEAYQVCSDVPYPPASCPPLVNP